MPSPIIGLHHVTATVDDAQADLDFAAGVLGLRLLKKTVNFDNPFVYHFYYGDGTGTPGTIWTTFPYRGHGVRHGRIGAGQVTATSFSVPEDALPYWKERLASHRVDAVEAETRFGESALVARDPSGLAIELVATHRDRRVPWSGSGIDHASAIRGLHSVTVASRSVARTIAFMTDILGFAEEGTEDGRTRLTINGNVPGHIVDVLDGQLGTSGSGGMGTVHHVAMGVVSSADQLQMRERLLSLGFVVTPVQDRQYFQSIYFREPGGVLFEIATSAPGFTLDEPGDALGRLLKLPSWEEEHRATIEAGLAPVILP